MVFTPNSMDWEKNMVFDFSLAIDTDTGSMEPEFYPVQGRLTLAYDTNLLDGFEDLYQANAGFYKSFDVSYLRVCL